VDLNAGMERAAAALLQRQQVDQQATMQFLQRHSETIAQGMGMFGHGLQQVFERFRPPEVAPMPAQPPPPPPPPPSGARIKAAAKAVEAAPAKAIMPKAAGPFAIGAGNAPGPPPPPHTAPKAAPPHTTSKYAPQKKVQLVVTQAKPELPTAPKPKAKRKAKAKPQPQPAPVQPAPAPAIVEPEEERRIGKKYKVPPKPEKPGPLGRRAESRAESSAKRPRVVRSAA
jgi:hypothetical protein